MRADMKGRVEPRRSMGPETDKTATARKRDLDSMSTPITALLR